MSQRTRRSFVADCGGGMMVAALGPAVAAELGLAPAQADGPAAPRFGRHERLVELMRSTPADRLMPQLVAAWRQGTTLGDLTAAAALANAQAFGGEDYIGFHTLMALGPALAMAGEQPTPSAPLPVLKVIYRNAARLQEVGGAKAEGLHPCAPPADSAALRDAVRKANRAQAEGALAAATARTPEQGLEALMPAVEDGAEVHRVVLAHRAWELVGLVGREHALAMLRQSLNYCLKNEEWAAKTFAGPRTLLPKLMDQHRLETREVGRRDPGAAWVDSFAALLFAATPAAAAEAAAAALADGIAPDAVFEAVAQAACELVLRDQGRHGKEISAGKPAGSTHGDSIGVHASDSANAWRQLAAAAERKHRFAATILGAYQVAFDRGHRGGDFAHWQPHPLPERLAEIKDTDSRKMLGALDEAVRGGDQARAAALAARSAEVADNADGVFRVLRQRAIAQDGALHAEKYYRTAQTAYQAARPAGRGRHLAALARVLASGSANPAPGLAQAAALLGERA